MRTFRAAIATLKHWKASGPAAVAQAGGVDRRRLRSDLLKRNCGLRALVSAVNRDGIAVVEGYWPPEKCAQARSEIDRLILSYPDAVHLFSGGADKRLFGVESASPVLASFHNDPFLRGFGELIGGLELYNFATLGARIDATPENNGSGDGWHRDAHAFQFKSILYLSDVTTQNGPFEFLPGSHKQWRAVLDTVLGGLPPAPGSRYAPAMIDRIARRTGIKVRTYPAGTGTLLLVNTASVHRGRPLIAGSRHALTNYYYHPFQISEERIEQFAPLVPGTAERIRTDLRGPSSTAAPGVIR
jgi:hypothetical protein